MSSVNRAEASIDLESVLWRTRGFSWDYDFLLEPSAPHSDGWYWMHQAVFAGSEPTETAKYLLGELENTGATTPFVAATFLDPVRRDEHGRPIAHFIVWFHLGCDASDLVNAIPVGWERSFLDHLSGVFGALDVFGGSTDERHAEAVKNPREALRRHISGIKQAVELGGRILHRSDCKYVGTIKKNWRPAQPNVPSPQRASWLLPLVVGVFVVILLLTRWSCSNPGDRSPLPAANIAQQ